MKNIMNLAIAVLVIIVLLSVIVLFVVPENNDDKIQDEQKFNENLFYVDNGTDDARTFSVDLSDEGFGNEDGYYENLQLSPSYSFGLRFNNISIPKNAIIIDAYVGVYSVGTPGHRSPNCKIYADNVSNAASFNDTIGVLNITGRNYTESSVLWNETVAYDQWVRTPSITSVVQEVIDNNEWAENNSIAILFVTQGYWEYIASFNNFERGFASRLHVEWKENTD